MVVLTEFEKAILLTFLILTKGSTRKLIPRRQIVMRVQMRRRAMTRRYIRLLVEKKLLARRDERYTLTKAGLAEARKLLVTGAKFLLPKVEESG
jgi:predicted transcriptional regulator